VYKEDRTQNYDLGTPCIHVGQLKNVVLSGQRDVVT